MKPIIIGIIGGIIGAIVVIGIIFFVEQDLEQTNYDCVQTFDNVLIPFMTGQISASPQVSLAIRDFELNRCASNHAQWEEDSVNYQFLNGNWDIMIKNEEQTLALQQKEQKMSDIKSEILSDDPFKNYKVNTECELVLLFVVSGDIAKFTFNEIQSNTFKTKYPDEINTIQKYNELYQSITAETKDASDAFKQFPPEVLDAIFVITSSEISINPQLKPFVDSLFFGELTNERAEKIALDDKTDCGSHLQELL